MTSKMGQVKRLSPTAQSQSLEWWTDREVCLIWKKTTFLLSFSMKTFSVVAFAVGICGASNSEAMRLSPDKSSPEDSVRRNVILVAESKIETDEVAQKGQVTIKAGGSMTDEQLAGR